MEKMEVRVARDVEGGEIKEGDELTFFYPSSEWDMSQGFECKCGTERCRGYIGGAKKMGREGLKGYWLNKHIEELLDEEEAKTAEAPATVEEVKETKEEVPAVAEVTTEVPKEEVKTHEKKKSCNLM